MIFFHFLQGKQKLPPRGKISLLHKKPGDPGLQLLLVNFLQLLQIV